MTKVSTAPGARLFSNLIGLYLNQIRLGVFAPRFYRARSINFLLKSVASAGGFNFIQSRFEPPIELVKTSIHLTTYRSGRLLLNEVKNKIYCKTFSIMSYSDLILLLKLKTEVLNKVDSYRKDF